MTTLSIGQVSLNAPVVLAPQQKKEDHLEDVLKEIDVLKDENVTSKGVRQAISLMQGETFFINPYLYEGIGSYFKPYINPLDLNNLKYKGLKDYVDLSAFEVDREVLPSITYPKEKLGNNIALRWFDNLGHTSVMTPVEMATIIKTVLGKNPVLASNFVNDLMLQAFYGLYKTKSY